MSEESIKNVVNDRKDLEFKQVSEDIDIVFHSDEIHNDNQANNVEKRRWNACCNLSKDSTDSGYAWAILVLAFILEVLTGCSLTSFGIMMVDIMDSTEQNAQTISFIGALLSTFLGLSGVILGPFMQKFGCRIIVFTGSIILASCYLTTFLVKNVTVYYFSMGVVCGIGYSCYQLGAPVAVSHWFEKRKAFSISVIMTGISVGSMIWGPITRLLINKYSWRGAALIIGGLQLHSCIIAILLKPGPLLSKSLQEKKKQPSFNIQLFKNKKFLIYCVSNFTLIFGHVVPFMMLPLKAETHGVSKMKAAGLVAIMGVCSTTVRPIIGFMSDKPWFDKNFAFAVFSILGGLLTTCSFYMRNYDLLIVYVSLFGTISGLFKV